MTTATPRNTRPVRSTPGAPLPRRYEIVAERDGHRWFLQVPELPGVFSQVRRLDQAADMARDAIASFLDIASDGFDVQVVPVLDDRLEEDLGRLAALRVRLEQVDRDYAELTRGLASRLIESEHLTVREAGQVLGLSHQRVAQLVDRPK